MSSYLRGLRKPELQEAAQSSKLPNYATYNVNELRSNLDDHLRANATSYSGSDNEHLKAYYEKAGLAPKSPVKKMAEKVSGHVSGDDTSLPVVKKRRKTATAPPGEAVNDATALVKTPAKDVTNIVRETQRRSSTILQQTQEAVAVSPARVAAVFETQVSRPIQAQVSKTLQRLHLAEYTDMIRDWASSPLAIALLALTFEAYGLRQKLLPFKPLTEVSLSRGTKQQIFVPDLFVLLTTKFWLPFSLWLATSVLAPLTLAYFINIPLKAQSSHSYGTRRATAHASTEQQYDPFVYFIAKALVTYVVYTSHKPDANHPGLWLGPWSHYSVDIVKENIPGGYATVLTTSAIGSALSLYEATLRR